MSWKPKEGGEEGASEHDFEDWPRLWEQPEKHQKQSHLIVGSLLSSHLLAYSQRDSAVSLSCLACHVVLSP